MSGRIVPSATARSDRIRLRRPPSAGRVEIDRRVAAQCRLDDAPSRLDVVLSRKKRRIASHRVADQAFVWRHFLAGPAAESQLHRFAGHGWARLLHAGAEGDLDLSGSEVEPKVIVRIAGPVCAEQIV